MAVTRATNGKSITITAVGDAVLDYLEIVGMTFQGSGLTAGHRVLVRDTSGAIIADSLVETPIDNIDLWAGRSMKKYTGLNLVATGLTGDFVLTVFCR